MKKAIKILLSFMAIMLFSSVGVLAGNTHSLLSFTYNSTKSNSSESAIKPADGDYNAYITTIETSPTTKVKSNVFRAGGIVYARTRLASAPSAAYSPLFTFSTYTAKVAPYTPSSMARFGSAYILRAETEGADYSSVNTYYQNFRWFP